MMRPKWKSVSKKLQHVITQETENTSMLIIEMANQSREIHM
jgi:hypothetical protein